ncbi:MAG: discoidin domain-containing protein, partial [Verrucomicrobia bacterium]|nr:discoidin domain-containing protein [Verrucomicrobiota bacterium]
MKSVELKLVILLLSATPVLAAPPGSDARRQKIESDWLIDEAVRADDKRVTNLTTREDAAGGCDGVKDGSYGFHTGKAKEPWWQVDVGERVSIARVVIWNRGEATERAAKLSVRFSDDAKEWATVYTHDGTKFLGFTDGKPLEVKLAAQAARYVRIQLSDEEFLHLDEVEVFGPEAPARNLALHRPADQVSISQWSTDHRPPPEPDWRKRAVEVLAHCERLVGELRETGDDSYATAKESKRKNSQRAVPLTPALSPSAGEREKVSQARINRKRPSSAKTPPAILPLPSGEGRGEGKGISRTPSLSSLESKLTSLTSRLASLPTDHSARPLFLEARWFQRTLALANPHLRGFDAILFTTRVPPSFNHMSDQYYGWWSKPGGGIYVLRDFTSDTPTTDCLTDAFKEPGNFLRPTLSYDGAKVLFAWCKHYSTLANEKD